MSDWKKVKVSDFLKRSKIPVQVVDSNEYKRVTIKIKHNGVSVRDIALGKKIGTKKQFILREGQFILSKIDARYGAFGVAPKEVDGAIITGNFWAYDIDTRIATVDWINNYTNSPEFYDLCERASSGITHRKYLDESKFLQHELKIPATPKEQIEILNKLESAKKIHIEFSSQLELQQNTLNALRQAVLQEAIQGKLTANWRKQNPDLISGENHASKLLQRIKVKKEKLIKDGKIKKEPQLPKITESEKPFELPNEWAWCRPAELGSFSGGGTPSTHIKEYWEGEIPWITPKDMKTDDIFDSELRITMKGIENSNAILLPENTLIFVVRSGILKRTVPISITKVKGTINQDLKAWTLLVPSMAEFLRVNVKGNEKRILREVIKKGMTVESFDFDKFREYLIPFPPLAEQRAIVEHVGKIMMVVDDIERQITERKDQSVLLIQSILREVFLEKKDNVQDVVSVAAQPREEKAFFKRSVLASHIINQSLADPQFGDTKFEKLLHLADCYAIKRNFDQNYLQQAAGPYDNKFTHGFWAYIDKQKWFKRIKQGSQYVFKAGDAHQKSKKTYNYFSADELQKVNRLISLFEKHDYQGPEIVSTLYAVWNNRIIRKQEIEDARLIEDFYAWDAAKKKYPKEKLEKALVWMRKESIVPDGWGKVIEKSATRG